MYKTVSFKKKILATLIASSTLGLSGHTFAQDSAEEIVVTGIKASLTAAMDIKRDSVGVVDAINAEDIGKMPDSNLAESLQRITGVSISRNNGEGSQVTVRGIDPSLNMITLNGRVMPAVSQGNTGDNASRAYDFSNLASESISGVDVYKTGKADVAAGGLGASINIKTLRPLEAGNKATFGAKAVQDESVRYGSGDKYTPEVSGLYSWVNEDANFGVALNAAHQVRDSSRSNVFINNWQLRTAGAATAGTSDGVLPSTATVHNAPAAGQLYNLPTDLRYQLEDITRTRDNAQLTLQFKPIDSLTGTIDYTYSENKITSSRAQQSTWYNINKISDITFDDGVVKSPLIYKETYTAADGKDVSFANEAFDTKTANNSFGVNFAWEATDALKLTLDYHKSSAESLTNDAQAGLNANVVTSEYADFRKDVPVMGITIDDSLRGNNNGVLDGGDVSGAMGTISMGRQRTEIEELQLKGSYALGDLGFFKETVIDFGIADRKNSNLSIAGDGGNRITMGNWGGINPAAFGADFAGYFTARDFGDSFPDASSTANDANFLHAGLTSDLSQIAKKMEYMNAQALTARKVQDPAFPSDPTKTIWVDSAGKATQVNPDNFNSFPNGKFGFNGIIGTNRLVEEDVSSIYGQFKGEFDVAGMPAHALLGVRYEKTDVTSTGSVKPPVALQWDSDNDWTTLSSSLGTVPVVVNASYHNLLPNLDLDVSPTDDLKVRLSYSETIGRASYQNLSPLSSLSSVYSKTASQGNPALKPMTSQNVDVSVEWYYDDHSYVSIGLFNKKVSDFIGTEVISTNQYGLRDVRSGPRFLAAQAALPDNLKNDEAALWTQILKNMGVAAPAPGTDKIYADANDPLMQWATTQPTNNKDATVHGAEFGIQHFFGESGFGFQANYTAVNSDAEFDNTLNSVATQFALIGVSNSANIVGIYEKNGFQARVAYNWRDAFLNSANQAGNNEPSYTKAFGTVDLSFGYELNDNVTFTLEGLNILGENSLNYGRSETQINSYEDLSARYSLGVRYTF
ncbi:MAG: TonB-dependent receptor [Gammaproteobacteria bacterium]|nr:MAG: TonB-dependent receptor [Gammaproteobacteria bacterium]